MLSDREVSEVGEMGLATQRALGEAEALQELLAPPDGVLHAVGGVPLRDLAVRQGDDHLVAILLALHHEVRGLEGPIGVALLDLQPVLLALDRGVRVPAGEEGRDGHLPPVLLGREEGPDHLALGVEDDLTRTDIDARHEHSPKSSFMGSE